MDKIYKVKKLKKTKPIKDSKLKNRKVEIVKDTQYKTDLLCNIPKKNLYVAHKFLHFEKNPRKFANITKVARAVLPYIRSENLIYDQTKGRKGFNAGENFFVDIKIVDKVDTTYYSPGKYRVWEVSVLNLKRK